jgi:DNA invertase Pin-like site-specific DNA recombinase
MNSDRIYRAAIYVRLSKEDGDSFSFGKNESDSITNQKLLIQNHLSKMPDIEVVATFEDDGFTGTNFDRPGFQKLVEAIKQKTVDCVVVKDFSRLGREYLEAGNYIEKVFPALGVRFISINDDYDSLHPKGQTDSLVVPFKNLLNEQYSRDTSGKIRSALSVKRQQGLFVGNFSVFGYKRDPENKNHLIIDEYAANIVQDIFKMKLEGLSYSAIAKRLTERKVPTPSDYKRENGSKYHTGFKVAVYSAWSAVAVKRILTNEVYCGHMIQGKRRKISYKVKTLEYLESEQWERIENTHEAIISAVTFNEVQRLLGEDTRVGERDCIYPLAGKVYCAECGGAMVRKMVPCNGKKYVYYVCGNNKQNSAHCSPHSIRAEKLEEAVLASLQLQIRLVLDMDRAMEGIDHLAWEQREVKKLQSQLDALDAEIQQHQELRLSVYEDLKSGLIDKAEYENLRRGFASRIEEAKKAKQELRGEQNALLCGLNGQQEFLTNFRQFANIQVLERNMVVALIDRVEVLDGSNINVDFRYEDRFASIAEFLDLQQRKDKLIVLQRKEA